MDWKALIRMIAISALSTNKKTAPMVPHVIAGIEAAEAFKAADGHTVSGAEKLQIAVVIAKEGFAATNAVRPGTINVPVADEVIGHSISAVVDATNVFKKAGLLVNRPALAGGAVE